MKIALFGGTGFIGKEVAARLTIHGHTFFEISRHATSPDSFKADITDYSSLSKVTEKATVAIVCSSALPKPSYNDDDLALFVNVNITGIYNILRWSRAQGISRIIYCSTLSMVPPSHENNNDEKELVETGSHYLYKITKSAGEHLVTAFCKQNNIQYFALRIASVYGHGMKKDIIDLVTQKINGDEKLIIHNSEFTVDFIHVKDVAKTILSCISSPKTNMIVNVASGKRIKLQELAQAIGEILGKEVILETKSTVPLPAVRYSVDKMKALLEDELISLENGLKDLLSVRNDPT